MQAHMKHILTFDPVPLIEAYFAFSLGRVGSGGHKDSAWDSAVEASPLAGRLSGCGGRGRPGRASADVQIKTPGSPDQRHPITTSTHPCRRLCLLRSSLSPILPRDGDRVRTPLGLLELRRVPVCLNPFREKGGRRIQNCGHSLS